MKILEQKKTRRTNFSIEGDKYNSAWQHRRDKKQSCSYQEVLQVDSLNLNSLWELRSLPSTITVRPENADSRNISMTNSYRNQGV